MRGWARDEAPEMTKTASISHLFFPLLNVPCQVRNTAHRAAEKQGEIVQPKAIQVNQSCQMLADRLTTKAGRGVFDYLGTCVVGE